MSSLGDSSRDGSTGHAAVLQQVESLTREVEARRRSIRKAQRAIKQARVRRQHAEDMLGLDLDGQPLRPAPMIWALCGGVTGLVGVFLTYLTGLLTLQYGRPDSDAWVALTFAVGAISLAAFTLVFSLRPGAGGSARAILRPLTYVCIALSVVALAMICLIRLPF